MTAGGPPISETLRRMIHGYQMSQALYVAATLGIADLLADGPQDVGALAAQSGCHAATLHRLLRLLASLGVFAEDETGRYELTPLAECLRSGVPGSQRDWAIMVCSPSFWSSWGDLLTSVRTGETAFPRVHGMDRWDYLAHHPGESAVFDAAMTSNTRLESEAVVRGYDFSGFGVLADIGGGAGGLLATILAEHQNMRGLLFDLPQVVAGARDVMTHAGVADRCDIVGGDFFQAVPTGADGYLLKSVIHDWNDEQSIEILRTCRSAMGDGAKLLLVERIIRPGNTPDAAKFIDLLMLVMNGGRERVYGDFERLLSAAGFTLTNVIPTGGVLNVLEAVPS
jgi:hypothetical protein